jgi:hypothetical protein
MQISSNWSHAEKRKHPRILVNLPAIYHSFNLTVQAYISDLSQEGLFLTCPAVDREGTAAEIQLTIPGYSSPLKLQGRVVWCRRLPPHVGMGFSLSNLSRTDRLALANFLIARIYKV